MSSFIVTFAIAFGAGRAAIIREVRAYHRRRLNAVPALVTALHRAA